MTNAQSDALEKVFEIIREHFEQGILIVTVDPVDDDKGEGIQMGWHGGYCSALGLLAIAKDRILAGDCVPQAED